MALKAGRVGVAPSQVDVHGRIIGGSPSPDPPTPVSEVKLYQHVIMIKKSLSGNYYTACFSIFNDSNTALTSADVVAWLNANGFTNTNDKWYPISGRHFSYDMIYMQYLSENTIRFKYTGTSSGGNEDINVTSSDVTMTDTVIEIIGG